MSRAADADPPGGAARGLFSHGLRDDRGEEVFGTGDRAAAIGGSVLGVSADPGGIRAARANSSAVTLSTLIPPAPQRREASTLADWLGRRGLCPRLPRPIVPVLRRVSGAMPGDGGADGAPSRAAMRRGAGRRAGAVDRGIPPPWSAEGAAIRHFYNPESPHPDNLFRATTAALLGDDRELLAGGGERAALRALADGGFLLLDSAKCPVTSCPARERRAAIHARAGHVLAQELDGITLAPGRSSVRWCAARCPLPRCPCLPRAECVVTWWSRKGFPFRSVVRSSPAVHHDAPRRRGWQPKP